MRDLPTGTVTFLFTDIEGSTEMVTALGSGYRAVLERHNELLRSAFSRHRGIDLVSQGDSLFAVFATAGDAVAAAIEAQQLLAAEPWAAGHTVNVRMGIHSGDGLLGGDSYVGLDVHRAARIASAANGGQVLVSDATRLLARTASGDAVTWLDLGRHRLKGLPEPEHVFQVSVVGLRSDFPPIHSLEAHPHNLPAAMTSFIGREAQIADLRRILGETRLLTLTGPGGTGKTRLGLRVAEEVVTDYEDGCWFVALDALRDPELVPVTIADALHLKVAPDQPVMSSLEAYLADRNALLVLDNFEQVASAGPNVAELLRSATKVRVLATSRAPLHVYGEREYPVPPLADTTSLELFVERATAVRPDFRVTDENSADVAAICARLDGLPLAIELAAARVKLLTPAQILARLGDKLMLAASSSGDLPERQRTLRGAIDWSYELLMPAEQRLFAALAVFRGGFTLEAAEEVLGSADLGVDVFEGVASLVDKSLVRTTLVGTETRFSMLETIRQYARERLDATPSERALIASHARHFFAFAREAEPALTGANQVASLERLERDEDNLRAAFDRAPAIGLLDDALLAAGSIWRFWQLRAHFAEGRAILERLLAAGEGGDLARERALTGAGGITYWQGDRDSTAAYYQQAWIVAERLGDGPLLAEALANQSYIPVLSGDFAAARPLLERAVKLYRDSGNEVAAIDIGVLLGWTYFVAGEPMRAIEASKRAVKTYRAADAKWLLADNLSGLALLQAATGEWLEAVQAMEESLAIFTEIDNKVGLAQDFDTFAAMAAWLGDAERAARLIGRAQANADEAGGGIPAQMIFRTAPFHELARAALGDERFDQLTADGAALSNPEAVELVTSLTIPPGAVPMPAQP